MVSTDWGVVMRPCGVALFTIYFKRIDAIVIWDKDS